SVFFVNAPAPTELSTLSLHDALPILRPRPDASGDDVARGPRCPERGAGGARRAAGGIRQRLPRGHLRSVWSRRRRPPARAGAGGDRKSTRLNSSHDQISYAVFCLKKK